MLDRRATSLDKSNICFGRVVGVCVCVSVEHGKHYFNLMNSTLSATEIHGDHRRRHRGSSGCCNAAIGWRGGRGFRTHTNMSVCLHMLDAMVMHFWHTSSSF